MRGGPAAEDGARLPRMGCGVARSCPGARARRRPDPSLAPTHPGARARYPRRRHVSVARSCRVCAGCSTTTEPVTRRASPAPVEVTRARRLSQRPRACATRDPRTRPAYAAADFGFRPRRATAFPGIPPAQLSQRSAAFAPRRASVNVTRITAPFPSSTSAPHLSQTRIVFRAIVIPLRRLLEIRTGTALMKKIPGADFTGKCRIDQPPSTRKTRREVSAQTATGN